MKVTVTPIKQVFINHLVMMDIQVITKLQAINENPLFWAKGYLFYSVEFTSPKLAEKEAIEGILHLDSFFYAKSPKISESKYNGNNVSVSVVDMTGNKTFEGILESLKK